MKLVDKILANKELRVIKQRELIFKFGSPLISLTINIPGIQKDIKNAKTIYEEAIKEIEKLPFKILKKISTCSDVGFEAIYAVDANAKDLKSYTCKIETIHPLGRFMDIDVIDKNHTILSRNTPRKCYICDRVAKDCARSQRHSIEELLKFIDEQVRTFKSMS
ncbi:citrate lyase holo-[acyl-carrier protein] synthase [Sulfurospirillum sp. 1307]|jgi:holo-ACP synthase CitX